MYLHDFQMPTDNNETKLNNGLSCTAPSSLDWREKRVVTAAKDQGSCGKYIVIYKISHKSNYKTYYKKILIS